MIVKGFGQRLLPVECFMTTHTERSFCYCKSVTLSVYILFTFL